jgi:hypothetical protein
VTPSLPPLAEKTPKDGFSPRRGDAAEIVDTIATVRNFEDAYEAIKKTEKCSIQIAFEGVAFLTGPRPMQRMHQIFGAADRASQTLRSTKPIDNSAGTSVVQQARLGYE